jgi:hypothetical protein
MEAEAELSAESRLSEEPGAVRISTLALASYWLGVARQYKRHTSSNPPSISRIIARRRATISQSSRREAVELGRLTSTMESSQRL